MNIRTPPKVGIYRLTAPNGKVYIGQSHNIETRWNHHRFKTEFAGPKLANSLQKYGHENFLFEILIHTDVDIPQEDLDALETQEILRHDAVNNGLNCRTSGNGGFLSEETKKKISIAHKGKPSKNKGKPSKRKGMPGKKHSEETKRRLSELNTGRKHTKEEIEKIVKARQKQVCSPCSKEKKVKLSAALLGKKHSEERRKKIAEGTKLALKDKEPWNKGKKMSAEYCAIMKEAHRHAQQYDHKNVSQETRQLLSRKLKGKPVSEETRKKISETKKLQSQEKRLLKEQMKLEENTSLMPSTNKKERKETAAA